MSRILPLPKVLSIAMQVSDTQKAPVFTTPKTVGSVARNQTVRMEIEGRGAVETRVD